MKMVNENWDQVAEDLERQELQAQGGVSSPQLYAKLLAVYLYQNDLCNAKFLWKRIPSSIKAQHPELAGIWAVGVAMWQRDALQIYTSLNAFQWSDNVLPVMKALKDRVQERNIRLISLAYSSINSSSLGRLLGLTAEEALSLARDRGWPSDGTTLTPRSIPQSVQPLTSTEHQLHKLTSFVSFLEN